MSAQILYAPPQADDHSPWVYETFLHLEDYISEAARLNAAPERFVMSAATLRVLIDSSTNFSQVRCHGQQESVQTVWLLHNARPLVPVQGRREFFQELGPPAIRGFRTWAHRYGVSHYRGIPIVIDDTQGGIRLDTRPWGDGV